MLFSNLIVSVCALNSTAASPIALRYKFHVGEVLSYQTTTSIDMLQQGSSTPFKFSIPSSTRMQVKSIAHDGTATLVMETTTGSIMGAKKQAKPMTMSMKLSPTGQMSGFQANDLPSGSSRIPSSVPALQVLKTLPQQAITVGSHWDSSTKMAMMGDVTVHNVVDKISSVGGSTIVTFHTSASADLSKLGGMMGGAPKDMEGSVSFGGETNFNATRGYFENSSISAKVMMSGSQNGQRIHVTGTITFGMKKTG